MAIVFAKIEPETNALETTEQELTESESTELELIASGSIESELIELDSAELEDSRQVHPELPRTSRRMRPMKSRPTWI